MSQNNVLKGVFLVALGATTYGMLATFVKMAYTEGYTTAEVTTSQFVLGIIGILLINTFQKLKHKDNVVKATPKNIFSLMLAGTSLGMTSLFYYLAVKYIPVSIGIVLLMQTVWIGVLLEMILEKKLPSKQKVFSVFIVLIGTVLATNILHNEIELDWRGLVWGMLAAASFTTTMFTANRVATEISSAQRSLYMLFGGAIIVFSFALVTQVTPFNLAIFAKWGIILALFGTIIPPMLMNLGFPLTGIGLGSIVSALELPVSVTMAYVLLNEEVILSQWIGIILIILAIVIMNVNFKRKNS
ncbi:MULTISPECIES: EamA family transporter [Flavobacterium]|jgi:drug/metabolite transporter (DMT)-like permease|uniref:EamA family transporter n=1 Tax=Flavobacterium tructae TaxID=1114873 RepID=A0A1S1J7V1_9FLAO|nr:MULTISPECIES: DMT family transporter [Flavobacterium]MDL2142021.1 DMT family transporter [Flavobacterium tructae]OHT45589.1 permease [Flavobacterium tructae]OXB18247.1 EamA family transporter [Flavobacterium tructae]OXB25595.1 EamA family transporter [Flavobacterium tructae]URC10814.1 DMT family transporter [Flavobacterium sp. B183]